jgi:type IV fimbrial biogenesis protein FimT
MKKSGFTLVEMLVTISILAILLAIGAPAFKDLISSGNMVSNANGMIGAFNYARTEAIKRGGAVNVDQVVAADWTGGIVVWVDADDGTGTLGVRDVGEELRLWPAFDNASAVSSAQATFSFSGTGEVNSAGVLDVCDDRTGEEGMQITILVSGVIISERMTCG